MFSSFEIRNSCGVGRFIYTVVTLNSMGSDVTIGTKGFELPLLEEAEVLGGGVTGAIGLLLLTFR